MDKYQVKLTPRAFRDIDAIFKYISKELLSPENAKGQTDRIWEVLSQLNYFPQSHQDRIVGRFAKKGYKQLLIDNYIAIFRINETSHIVTVVTVQYQGRNL